MAEFAEVMRQWGRLCRQHCGVHNDDCDGCLLGGTRADVCGSYAKDNAEDVEELERLVMEWAAEHPEPVYPTWVEWLIEKGVIPEIGYMLATGHDPDTGEITEARISINPSALKPIQSDLAEKLGIEPK